ncbi:MAG: alpha/beta hydrolase, partial [Caldilineaceae bacterium]|nr:alpha/beta hydrolase [Caldilineaceae bacterium]
EFYLSNPQPLSVENSVNEAMEFANVRITNETVDANCIAELQRQGIDLNNYNTNNTVRDAIALMDHLDYPEYNLFGISYGTLVALQIAKYYDDYPNANLPALRSMLIDGVYPANIDYATAAYAWPREVRLVFEDCEADPICGETYPNIGQRFVDLIAELDENPVPAPIVEELDGVSLVILINKQMLEHIEMLVYLPRLIAELEKGETATLEVFADLFIGGTVAPPHTDVDISEMTILDPLTSESSAIAEELRSMAERLENASSVGTSLTEVAAGAETLPELYLNLLNHHVDMQADWHARSALQEILIQYARRPITQNRQGLINISSGLPNVLSGELISIVNQMSDDEIADVFDIIASTAYISREVQFNGITTSTVNCNDRYSDLDYARMLEVWRTYDVPYLLIQRLDPNAYLSLFCSVAGIDGSNQVSKDPVVTDLPSMVFTSSLDHQTAVAWGEIAHESLANSDYIRFPMSDHGAVRYSNCARDIANAFFAYPEVAPNRNCVENLRPDFSMPEDELPVVSAN